MRWGIDVESCEGMSRAQLMQIINRGLTPSNTQYRAAQDALNKLIRKQLDMLPIRKI
jgi:hypothetical protein